MTVRMPTLTRAKGGDWFSRKVIPADVRDAYERAYGLRHEERFREPAARPMGEAKRAFAEWVADIEARIAALRAAEAGTPVTLSNRQLRELIGRWYDWIVLQHESESTPADHWDVQLGRYQDAVEVETGAEEREGEDERSPRHASLVRALVVELSRLPTFLAGEGVRLSHDAHDQLADALEPDLVAAMSALRRRAGGDYRPDPHRARFPQAASILPANAKLSGWNAWDAFEAWVKERKPAASTLNRWRGVFEALNEFAEGRDIALLTDEDAVAWKDKLVSGGGKSARTINQIWLTAAGRVFTWAVAQKKIAANPFKGLKVAAKRTGPTKGAFKEEDAETILRAALIQRSTAMSPHLRAAIRWVPWLCAYTGARAGEMTQLRKEDIERHRDGFWIVLIRTEAGTVKGGTARAVVLHDHLVEQGFPEFVGASKAGPLFYDAVVAKGRKAVDCQTALEWAPGSARKKDPSPGWLAASDREVRGGS